jgi:glycolate oxidase FAD binding subunit
MSTASVAARRPEPGDVVLGVRPSDVYEPASLQEAADVLAECAARKEALLFTGGRTSLELGAPPTRLDALVSTRRMTRILEHAPSDQIVSVEAGLPLASLQRALASSGQRLALDPPLPEKATLGGLIASNAFGPSRARFGSVRDLLIGVTLVRADGTVAQGGGKVGKNVAGFDLPKLMVGSLGTLALVAEATFRLHPRPELECTVLLEGRSPADVMRVCDAVRAAQIEPASVAATTTGLAFSLDLAVRFEGFAAGVASQRDAFLALEAVRSGAATVLDDASARSRGERHDALRTSGALRAKACGIPHELSGHAGRLFGPLLSALSSPAMVWYPTLGIVFASGEPDDEAAAARSLADARAELVKRGGSLVLETAPESLRRVLDVWGPPPAALAVMKRMKEALDPDRRLAPGRFAGGL